MKVKSENLTRVSLIKQLKKSDFFVNTPKNEIDFKRVKHPSFGVIFTLLKGPVNDVSFLEWSFILLFKSENDSNRWKLHPCGVIFTLFSGFYKNSCFRSGFIKLTLFECEFLVF